MKSSAIQHIRIAAREPVTNRTVFLSRNDIMVFLTQEPAQYPAGRNTMENRDQGRISWTKKDTSPGL